ncbi:MAG: hypothetical protein ACLGIS_02140, partial [Actinomycetes bacterium]
DRSHRSRVQDRDALLHGSFVLDQHGDIEPAAAEVAGWISPNPGGVGPMTVALLMTNVVEAAERAAASA